MTLLYPRITPAEAKMLLARYDALSLEDIRAQAGPSPVAFYGTTGGTPADPGHLGRLVDILRACARDAGYPRPPDDRDKILFDRAGAKALHATMNMTPAEAGQPDVWTCLATCLVPDVVAWRFGTRTHERWIGTGLVRHTFARLWWQAHALAVTHDGSADYSLLDRLSESDLNQIFERRAIGGTPPLARALARELTAQRLESASVSHRAVVRDVTKRLRRLLPFTSFASLDETVIQHRMHALVSESVEALEKETLREA
ncbi:MULTISPECIES: DUF6339 family protein [unclassified Streptomyces]|uniref:DUF6339 family protein n=1 Tax=unclassified Streptomyces TaxID=2593676 RepID=UPI001164031A|nr:MULTISPECIES: DUF6339 family protein [unclassified Streptomyces]NMI54273.1 hypothetical protein [Streptomyces sp. RLA2-12]QDN63132.1 hypothetical protein FNV67_55565 [Streptomyces sp. S1D4-20]QDN73184.1 hypothetical protein FNV66_54445 [Streptomyces sp. S1D4-14]QDO55782.1 hypothetical protein FNV60_53860 [Streptomyces sp. RLB3-5]QDO56948.1 hypothetical protein FNV59_00310 [Streptomyces sp. RLB1-8]